METTPREHCKESMVPNETVFLTGFPGFIASRLLRRLAAQGNSVLLLVHPALISQAQLEIREIADQTAAPITNFRILEGDLTKPDLGLSSPDRDIASSESRIIFHLAALYDLAVARDLAIHVNVEGTRRVNEFARRIPDLRHYHYVSTCYVAGRRQGRILETELRHEGGFRNHYEESKYLAELSVDSLKAELPVTIHRPSVVCGDSNTGVTAKYDGIYYLIRYLLRWPRVLSLFNIGNHEVRLNLVPVDFVVDAMVALSQDEHARGKTVQLADSNPLTTHQLCDTIARCLTGRGSKITVPASLVQFTLMLPPSPAITGLPHNAVPYFFLNQTYDTSEATRLLEAHDVECPPFASYAETIVEYAASHR